MDVIMFSDNVNSFILTYCPFKYQINKISLVVLLTLICIILLTYGYCMTFQKPLWESVTSLHLHYFIVSLNLITSFIYFAIMTIMNKLHVLYMQDIYMPYLFHYKSSSLQSFNLHACLFNQ